MSGELGNWGVPVAVLAGAIRVSTPFIFVSLGECITERSGRVNLGLEGTLVMGAMVGYGTSYLSGSPWLGVLGAGLIGVVLGALHGFLCSRPRVNDVAVGIGLMLFCLRALQPHRAWRDGWVRAAFWLINGGLLLMVLLSVLPVGLLQTRASVEVGYWYARSSEFLQAGLIDKLRWMRVIGDTLFAAGAVALVIFVIGLGTGSSYRRDPTDHAPDDLRAARPAE